MTTTFCGPCHFKHISTPAVAWCPVCNEGTCITCNEQHSAFSLTRNHEVIDIEHYKKLPNFVQSFEMTCYNHDKKLDFYCTTHNYRCCLDCIPEKHQKCSNVSTMENVVKNVKTSPAFIDALQGWNDLLHNILEIIQVKQKHLETITQTKTAIETEIKMFRKEINELLDKFEMRSLHNLDNIYSRITTADQTVLSYLSDKKAEMETFFMQCETIKALASDLQAFVAVNHISEKLMEEESAFTSLLETCALKSSVLNFEKNETFRSLGTKLKDLGKIKVSSCDVKLNLSQRKNDQAQFMPVPKVHPEDIKTLEFCLKESLSISPDNYAVNIKDCTILPDNRCVFADFAASKRLLVYTPSTKRKEEVAIPLPAFGITKIEKSLVALLVQDENEIQFFELQDTECRFEKKIILENRGWSLSSCNDKIAVSVKDRGIMLMNKNGYKFESIPIKCESYVAVHLTRDKLYYTDSQSHTIHCCSHNGKAIWKHHLSDQRNRYSIATDNAGHVYVACQNTKKIILISNDGKITRTLQPSYSPSTIAFNCKTKELLFATSDGEISFLGLL